MTLPRPSTRVITLWCALVALDAVLIGWQAGLPRFPDEGAYKMLAASLAEGRGLQFVPGRPTAMVVPVHPWLVSLCFRALGGGVLPVYLVMNLCFSLVMALAYGSLAADLTKRRGVGRCVAVIVFLLPPYVRYSSTLLTEVPYSALLALALLMFHRTCKAPDRLSGWIWLGFFHGVSFMTRPVTFLLTPLVLLWPLARGRFSPRAWKGALVAGLAVLAIWTPWVARNYAAFHRFVPLSTYSGLTLLAASLPDPFTFPEEAERAVRAAGLQSFWADEYAANRAITDDAVVRIAADPAAYLTRVVRWSWRFWLGGYKAYSASLDQSFHDCLQQERWGLLGLKLALLGLDVAVPLALLFSVLILWRQADYWPYLLLIAYFWCTHSLLLALPRYSVPLVGLVVVLAATAGAQVLVRRADGRSAMMPA
jgi:hypothetical protein